MQFIRYGRFSAMAHFIRLYTIIVMIISLTLAAALSVPLYAQAPQEQQAGEIPQEQQAVEQPSLPMETGNAPRNDGSIHWWYYHNSPTGNPWWSDNDTGLKTGLRYSFLVGGPVVTLLWGSNAWNWGENKNWRWGHERWFQRDTDSGGADKAGHCFAHYMQTGLLYSVFSYTERSQNTALLYSGLTVGIIGTMIEVGDAFTGRYGFSYEDLIADYVGIAVSIILHKYPTIDAFIGFTAHYWPTEGFRNDENKSYLNFAGDYSGWKFMINFKLGGFAYLGFDMPEFLRYVQFDVGYYTREYTEYDNQEGEFDARRHWFFGVSVDMRQVARDFGRVNRKFGWVLEQPFKYYHVPIGIENDQAIDDSSVE
jgi:hypothetical protein